MTVPLIGVVCEGALVQLAWPEPHEIDQITALRNERRHSFFDPRLLDVERNRLRLMDLTTRPSEAVLAIRWRASGILIGTIGWSHWCVNRRAATFGRLVMHLKRCVATRPWPAGYSGPTLDAANALRDFAFNAMGLERLECEVFDDNVLSQRILRAMGFVDIKPAEQKCTRSATTFSLSRSDYERLAASGSQPCA